MQWTAERRGRAAFFALNCLAAFSLFLPAMDGAGLAAFLSAAALAAYLTVYCPGGNTPACAGLPVLLALDLWAMLASRLPDLAASFHLPAFSNLPLVWLVVAAAGLGLSFTLLREQFWTRALARTVAGAALLLCVWRGAVLFPLALYVGAALLWQTARDVAEHADPSVRRRDDTLSILVYVPVLALICFDSAFLMEAAPRWFDLARSLCAAFLRGHWAAVPPALLLFAALASFDRDRAVLGLDVFVLLSALSFNLLLLAYAAAPFAHGWLILALFLLFFVRSARRAAEGKPFLRLEPRLWLAVQFAVCLCAILLVRRGLYGNLLVSAASAAALYAAPRKQWREDGLFWAILLLAVFAEAAAWLAVRRLCAENLAALGTLAAASALTLVVLDLRYMHGVPWRWRAAVCGLAALGCLGLSVRHGVRADASFGADGNVTVRVEAREDGAAVSQVSYQWKTWGGDRASVSFQESELVLPVRGERLVIDAVDDSGVRTVSTFWTPWAFPEG